MFLSEGRKDNGQIFHRHYFVEVSKVQWYRLNNFKR